MISKKYPNLLQLSARPWLYENNWKNISEVPDEILNDFQSKGIDAIYLLGVWALGQYGLNHDRTYQYHIDKFLQSVPDLKKEDIIGSPFAITQYIVNQQIGSHDDMQSFKKRLNGRGIKLYLDFVPNHCAIDSPKLGEHPEFYIRQPFNNPSKQLLNGFYYGGAGLNSKSWIDTLQYNLFSQACVTERINDLLKVAELSDGCRCDVAHFALASVFSQNWGCFVQNELKAEFWTTAISTVRSKKADYVFIAEEYGNHATELVELGFNFCYDKDGLLHALEESHMDRLRAYVQQANLAIGVHFVENHDDNRAAQLFKSNEKANAAATITFTLPGLKFYFQGQFQGLKNKLIVQLSRGQQEQEDKKTVLFYDNLLQILKDNVFQGNWTYQKIEGNEAWRQVAWTWHNGNKHALIIVNFTDSKASGKVKLPVSDGDLEFIEKFTNAKLTESGQNVRQNGFECQLDGWGSKIFFYEQ